MKTLAIAIAALGLSATTALAQTTTNFADLDTDASGELSFEEVTVVWTELTQEEFTAADTDASGELSAEEVATMQGATTAPLPADGGAMAPADGGAMAPAPADGAMGGDMMEGGDVDAVPEEPGIGVDTEDTEEETSEGAGGEDDDPDATAKPETLVQDDDLN